MTPINITVNIPFKRCLVGNPALQYIFSFLTTFTSRARCNTVCNSRQYHVNLNCRLVQDDLKKYNWTYTSAVEYAPFVILSRTCVNNYESIATLTNVYMLNVWATSLFFLGVVVLINYYINIWTPIPGFKPRVRKTLWNSLLTVWEGHGSYNLGRSSIALLLFWSLSYFFLLEIYKARLSSNFVSSESCNVDTIRDVTLRKQGAVCRKNKDWNKHIKRSIPAVYITAMEERLVLPEKNDEIFFKDTNAVYISTFTHLNYMCYFNSKRKKMKDFSLHFSKEAIFGVYHAYIASKRTPGFKEAQELMNQKILEFSQTGHYQKFLKLMSGKGCSDYLEIRKQDQCKELKSVSSKNVLPLLQALWIGQGISIFLMIYEFINRFYS